ncbi:MAG: hypothetical protein HC888_11795 [Candidatus Competibacteraceae bacterium]|nr:hypothetical protein [Candidatus Competibacteraceae bacterium]
MIWKRPSRAQWKKQVQRPAASIYQKAIQRLNGRNHTIKILAVPGAMASDQLKVVEYLLEEKKQPGLLIFTYAPRDFMANDVGDNPDYTPTGRVFHFSNLEHNFLPRSLSPDKLQDCFKAHGNFIDSVRRWKLRQLKELACKLTSHPETLFHAAYQAEQMGKDAAQAAAKPEPVAQLAAGTAAFHKSKSAASGHDGGAKSGFSGCDPEQNPPPGRSDLYKSRYQPINHKRIKQQLSYMEEMLSRLQKANVPVILLGMPISKENQDIIGQEEYRRLRLMIAAAGTRYGAEVIDLNEGPETFSLDKDFTDSVHLNQVGAVDLLI